MVDSGGQTKTTQEVESIDSARKAVNKLRQNLKELSDVLESNYTFYLNPKIISRMEEMLEGRRYDVL